MQGTLLFSTSLVSVTLLGLVPSGDAECCRPYNAYAGHRELIYRCADCTRPSGKYCAAGRRGCDVFGCNCDGGCRRPVQGRICSLKCCDFDGREEMIDTMETERVSAPMPAMANFTRYQKNRLESGTATGPNEYPMMTALIDNHLRPTLYCGATLVSADFVLTAAHCLLNRTPPEVSVLVGSHVASIGTVTDSTDLILSREFVMHPQYDSNTEENDIALVKLSVPTAFSDKVAPACMPFRFNGRNLAGLKVTVLGWGMTELTGPTSSRLLQTKLNVVNHGACLAAHPEQVITDAHLCTVSVDDDACQHDSGGPVLWKAPRTGFLFVIGIVGFGVGCSSGKPSINTRVDVYLDWIQQHIHNGLDCDR